MRDGTLPPSLTSHPASRKSFSSAPKSAGCFASASSMKPRRASRWEGFFLSPSHLLYFFPCRLGFSTMDRPFSMQRVSESRRTALVLFQKLRNFRLQSRAVEFQMM